MQIIFKNENERSNSRKANLIDVVVCAERISRYMKRECIKRSRSRRSEI